MFKTNKNCNYLQQKINCSLTYYFRFTWIESLNAKLCKKKKNIVSKFDSKMPLTEIQDCHILSRKYFFYYNKFERVRTSSSLSSLLSLSSSSSTLRKAHYTDQSVVFTLQHSHSIPSMPLSSGTFGLFQHPQSQSVVYTEAIQSGH